MTDLLTHWLMLVPLVITGLYVLLIAVLMLGWLKLPAFRIGHGAPTTKVSVIIAARNEAHVIETCISALATQHYPPELFEVLVVDDASEDDTALVVKTVAASYPAISIEVLHLPDEPGALAHKKRAIRHAMQQATGALIVTTDADCRMNPNWLSTLVAFYEQEKPKMIVAPVMFEQEQNIFEQLQTLEFMSLQGVTGGAAALEFPLMCNGANLAYDRKAYEALEAPSGPQGIASGDDVFLMLAMKKHFPGGVRYLRAAEAIVYTEAQPTLTAFLSQRRRWASKSKAYRDFPLLMVSFIVLLTNVLLLATGLTAILYSPWLWVFLTCFSAKCIIDFSFLLLVASFFHRKQLLLLALPEQLLYIIYVAVMGVTSPIGSYRWKGRKTR